MSWMVLLNTPSSKLEEKMPNKHMQEEPYKTMDYNPTEDESMDLEMRRGRRRRRLRYLLEEARAEMMGGGSGGSSSEYEETPSSQIEMLSRQVKQLRDRVDDVEYGGEGFAIAKDGAVVGDDLFKKLPGICKKAMKVLKNPPDTWKQYIKEDSPMSIYKMETQELKKALDKGGGNVDKEVIHVLAALFYHLLSEDE